MKIIMMMVMLMIVTLFIGGCQGDNVFLIKKDVCKQPGSYCHTFNTNESVVYLNFSSVANGTFNYTVST